MQWSLFVLVLMGQCSLCVCCLYEYHFVEEEKTWEEAQAYCRRNYTDLATVFDLEDVKRLKKSKENGGDAWIGLRKHTNVNRTWRWSQPGLEFNDSVRHWQGGEPNNEGGNENCVSLLKGKWVDSPCSTKKGFICYDEKQKKFHLIDQKKTWLKAQRYCRDEHTDLVSGLKQLKDPSFLIESEGKEELWIGLFADTWRWSDDSNFSFRHWHVEFKDNEDNKTCATTGSNGGKKWRSNKCNEEKNFFCYDDDVILINKKMTWERALTYCRENYYELVSITTPKEQRWVQERAKKANSTHVWMGLRFTCTLEFWFWVTDEVVKYKNWVTQETMDECDMSGAMETGGQHKWFKKNANTQFNFICFK